MYDYLIVGAGLFGSVFAHEMKKAGKKVLVLEQRDHIGGNVYTRNEGGINVHVYGPHIFHTSSKRIWDYVNQFATFNHYTNRPKARIEDRLYSLPINMNTLHQLWGVITPAEAEAKLKEVRVQIAEPANLEEWVLSQVGEEIYQKFIYGYTKKQWAREPRLLPASIIKRLPIRLTYDDNYFNDPYQGIPVGGYTQIIEKMLDGVEVKIQTPFEKTGWRNIARRLVYSGCIDSYFDYQFGRLEYRTLEFKSRREAGDFQGNAIVNYPSADVPYTRIMEHKHFEFLSHPETVVTEEYPASWGKDSIPYYPINDEQNSAVHKKYAEEIRKEEDVIVGGRLGRFLYYDMHQVIGNSLAEIENEKNR